MPSGPRHGSSRPRCRPHTFKRFNRQLENLQVYLKQIGGISFNRLDSSGELFRGLRQVF
jgi:hypothetical protein